MPISASASPRAPQQQGLGGTLIRRFVMGKIFRAKVGLRFPGGRSKTF